MNPHPRVAVVQESLLAAVITWRAFHRDVPELQTWGESPEVAVSNLADRLGLIQVDAPDRFHRETIEQSLADVRAVLDP